ncbi:septum site-determining protein MinC [Colwellia sp. Arc7-635]|uniref:septum site-determining protein MinC n=1 Tax=Colwellia sp. Arc7-635 TaxID=2497879 RepID=UPI001F4974DC|nr:septum site-determining protein MinC [Colwellia sp. Arc7-635]
MYTDKVYRGQIRSGQQVYAKDQNLVVIGSVSAGAEVIADGNIHVYGSLRGRAIAVLKVTIKQKYIVKSSRQNWFQLMVTIGLVSQWSRLGLTRLHTFD